MRSLSNTAISVVFAVGVTIIVALLINIPFFADKETQTTDEMMLLRYHLHNKYSPFKPDPHIVIAEIDARSLQDFGRWPFSRAIHGDFLLLLSQEKPKTVGWDIFFTEREGAASSDAPAPAQTDSTSTPSATPDAQSTTPAAPANPPAPSTNSGTPAAPAAAAKGSTTDNSVMGIVPVGAGSPTETATPAPANTPTETSTTTAQQQAPAANTPSLDPNDQHFVDAATLFPTMVTAAEKSDTPQIQWNSATNAPETDKIAPLTDQDFAPTKAFKNVAGDTSKLLSAPWALLPIPELRAETYFGFVNENGESGGGSRHTDPMIVNIAGKILPSFDLQVLMQFWGVDPDKVTIDIGHEIVVPKPDGTQTHIPIDERGQLTLNYRANLEDFQAKSYAQFSEGLYEKSQGQKSKAYDALPPIKDNLVVVGVTVNGIDTGVTPLSNNSPLVVTHLNALTNILQGDYLKPASTWLWLPIYALFLFGMANLMLRVGVLPLIPIFVGGVLLLGWVAFAALWFGNYSVPLSTPELGLLLLSGAVPAKRFFGEEREKLRVKNAMRAYLSDKVMNKILAHPDGVKLGGVKQVITIMFCDIRGFTSYCDNRDPQEVLNVVNEYFEEMTQVVFKYEGTVDKYIGDCIMAFWNAPEEQPDHAQRAVCCAMEMRYALANFKVKRAGLDTELFECGIGIHTGEALVGNMGSTLKVNYTAMGSTVNLGARLESLTKKLNERILISRDTYLQLQGEFPITDRGEALVPGFANPIHVYGVGAEQDLSSALKVGLKLAKKQEYTAEEVTKPIWAPAPLPEDADPNP